MSDKLTEERNELFDSAVREQLTGYDPQVPHALWNRIASELDQDGAPAEKTVMPQYYQKASPVKWKMSIAAAVLLTLALGSLLYTLAPKDGVKSAAPVAHTSPAAVPAAPSVATIVPAVKAGQNKMVASAAPVKVIAPAKTTIKTNAPGTRSTEVAGAENTSKQEMTAQEQPLEFAPVSTENRPVEVGNIPLASLNFLSTPSTVNDEITVIKSVEKKKRHGRRGEEESTKVILIGKKFDSKPDIRYQVPLRF